MSYIDTSPASSVVKLTEDNFQEKFAELLTENGFKHADNESSVALAFRKTIYAVVSGETKYVIANHTIFKNAKGKLFGMAVLAEFSDGSGTPETKADIDTFLEDKYDEKKTRTTVYWYMLEKLPTITEGSNMVFHWDETELKRMALDVEVHEIDSSVAETVKPEINDITVAEPMVMQSPVVQSDIRGTMLNDDPLTKIIETNWWSDSVVRVEGIIDENSIFVTFQCDNVPAWENNVVPTVPFYFGEIDPVDEGDDASAMFGGTLPPGLTPEEVASFDFSDKTPVGERIMPILKTYPNYPGNGIDNVIMSRSKFGSRYQSYFLSWNANPGSMPPERKTEDGKTYPRAWNNLESGMYKYQFNPSNYSRKVHTSKIYLIHPEEGVRGSLSNTIGLNSTNVNAGNLRIRKANCPDKTYDIYKFHLMGAVSPLTKRPATPFAPAGVGIFDKEHTETTTQ